MALLTKSSSSAEKFAKKLYGATVVVVAATVVVVAIVVVGTRGGSIFIPVEISTAQVLFTQSRTFNAD
jgi:hypothetical protein